MLIEISNMLIELLNMLNVVSYMSNVVSYMLIEISNMLHSNLAIPESQRYPWNLYMINNDF